MIPSIEVQGADELRRALRQIEGATPKMVGDANKSAAKVVVDRALPHVPVRSGRLKQSVRALGSQKSGRAVAGNARVPYAAAIHWGRKMGNVWGHQTGVNPIAGRPFLWDAAKNAEGQIVETYEREVKALIERVLR